MGFYRLAARWSQQFSTFASLRDPLLFPISAPQRLCVRFFLSLLTSGHFCRRVADSQQFFYHRDGGAGVYESDLLNALHFAERAKSQSDAKAWEELIGFYRRYIYVIIRSQGVNEDDTEDVLQQVLVELWKYLPDYKYDPKKAKFRYWVATVTRNQVVSFIRRQQSHAKKLDKAQQESQESYLNSINTPEVEEIATKSGNFSYRIQLWITWLNIFLLKHWRPFELFAKGMKVNDISQKLEVKADSVYKYISRIKVKLVEEIQNLKRELDF